MGSLQEVLISIVFSTIFVSVGSLLCAFTVREKLRVRWYWLVGITLALSVIYYGFRLIHWTFILPFLGLSFLVYRAIADVQPQKLLFLMMVVVSYLLFSNSVFYIFEGSAYTWNLADLDTVLIGFCVSGPFMLWLLNTKIWPSLRNLDTTGIRWLWVVPAAFMSLNVIMSSSHLQSLWNREASWLYTLLTSLFAIASAIVSFLVVDMLKKARDLTRYEDERRMIEAQLSVQVKRFEELAKHVQNVRVMRHDMRHHIRVVEGLLCEGNVQEAKEYLKNYDSMMEEARGVPISANFIGDIIGRRAHETAAAHGIDVDIQCALPVDCFVADLDLCVVLGNLMENALNACIRQQFGRKYIRATARQIGDEVQLFVENSCECTNVEDQLARGLGMPSITAMAERYGGITRFSCDETVFIARVLMYRQADRIAD